MNIIICSQQGSFYKTTKDDFLPSVVSRLSKVSNFSSESFTSIRTKPGGRKARVKYRSKVQRLVDALVNCISSKQQMLTLKEVLKNPTL